MANLEKNGMTEQGKRNPHERKILKLKKDQIPNIVSEADEKVQQAIIWLLSNEQFFGNLIISLKRKRTFDIPTMAVYYDNGFHFIYNPVFALSLSKPNIVGIIKHELFHLIFKHISRKKGISDFEKWNIAADLAINSIIKDYIPEGGMFPDIKEFEHLKLEWLKNAEYYYNRLDEKAMGGVFQKTKYKVKIKGSGQQQGQGKGQPQQGQGQGQGQGQDQGQSDMGGDQTGNDEIEVEVGGMTDIHDWDGEKQKDVPEEVLEIDIKQLLENAYNNSSSSKMWGNTPADLIKEIEAFIFKKSEIPWQVLFRKYILFAKKIFNISTRQKKNKKYGYAFPGTKVKEKLSIACIFDTSGSVSEPEFLACINELYSMSKAVDTINIVHADTKEYDLGKLTKSMLNGSGRSKLNRHGYGGTEFLRPLEYTFNKYKPDVIVYLTDGYADLNFTPPKVPIVWVITNDQATIPKRLGRTVRLKVNQEGQ